MALSRRTVLATVVAVAGAACGLELSGTSPADGGAADATAPDASDEAIVESGADGDGDAMACDASPCVAAIALGIDHSCAVLADGGVRCWGQNTVGELGFGVDDGGVVPSVSSAPGAVLGLAPAMQIATGGLPVQGTLRSNGAFTCARTGPTALACWGSDGNGQLGRGADAGSPDTAAHPRPLAVRQASVVTQVDVGGAHACALLDGGAVECWGWSDYGQLARPVPPSVDPVPSRIGMTLPRPATAIALGGLHSCALLDDGTVACWGFNNVSQLGRTSAMQIDLAPARAVGVADAESLAAGYANGCATLAGGALWCWGFNALGALGRGTTTNAELPGPVALPPALRATQACVGAYHACARTDDGGVWCWGQNASGQLGYGTLDSQFMVTPSSNATPARVVSLPRARSVACGGYHTCALLEGGSVACWGSNASGQLARGADAGIDGVPHPIPLLVFF